MKKIWLAPMLIAITLVFIVAAWLFNSMRGSGFAKETAPVIFPNSYGNSVGRPSSGYTSLKGPSVVADLDKSLQATVDDGGASDFQDLQKEANNL